MTTLTIIALIFLALIILTAAGILWILCWIAQGEPDSNGDPERDSGRAKVPPSLSTDRADDNEHIVPCETCGQPIDRRRLDEVLFHEDHQPRVATGMAGVRIN